MTRVMVTLDVEGDDGTDALRGLDDLPRLLDGLESRQIPATLFVVGDLARRRPEAIRALSDRGHEVASHSMTHPALGRCDVAQRRAELRDSKAALEDATGRPCVGFRAPFFDLPRGMGPELADAGYRWSSSKAPFSPVAGYRHLLATNRGPHALDGSAVTELPVPRMFGLPIPEGLSYRRLFWPLSALAAAPPSVFYLHPYEVLQPEGSALPRHLRPFIEFRRGAWAEGLLWRTLDGWRDRGARFVTAAEALA